MPNNACGQLRDLRQRVIERAAAEGRERRGLAQPYPTIIGRDSNNRAQPRLLAAMGSNKWHHIWDLERKPGNPNNTHLGATTDNPSLTSIQKVIGLSLCIKTPK